MDGFVEQLMQAGYVTEMASNSAKLMENGKARAAIQIELGDADTTRSKAFAEGVKESASNAEFHKELGKASALIASISPAAVAKLGQGVAAGLGLPTVR